MGGGVRCPGFFLFVIFVRSGGMKAIIVALIMALSFTIIGCGDDDSVTIPKAPKVTVPTTIPGT
jgi:hypothetical protein